MTDTQCSSHYRTVMVQQVFTYPKATTYKYQMFFLWKKRMIIPQIGLVHLCRFPAFQNVICFMLYYISKYYISWLISYIYISTIYLILYILKKSWQGSILNYTFLIYFLTIKTIYGVIFNYLILICLNGREAFMHGLLIAV